MTGMRFLTDFADQAVVLPMVLAVAVVLVLQGWPRGAKAWLSAVLFTFSIMLAMKLVCLGCTPVFGPADIRSPSGHVAAATVVTGGVTVLLTRRRLVILAAALGAAALIGVSRVVLGMHSPPEVALGAAVGLAGTLLLLRLAGPPPPSLRPGRVLGVIALAAVLFHGLHLPAEAAIRHTALHTIHLLAVCEAPGPLPPR